MLQEKIRLNRERSFITAKNTLEDLGFIDRSDNEFEGFLDNSYHIKIKIPDKFPDIMPEIFWLNKNSNFIYPHVEKAGKICLASSSFLLLDLSNPAGIIIESLKMVKDLITKSLSKDENEDIFSEFNLYINSYFSDNNTNDILSLIREKNKSRKVNAIFLSNKDFPYISKFYSFFIFENQEDINNFFSKSVSTEKIIPSIFIKLKKLISLSDISKIRNINKLLDFINNESDSVGKILFERTLFSQSTWFLVQFSFNYNLKESISFSYLVTLPKNLTFIKKEIEKRFRSDKKLDILKNHVLSKSNIKIYSNHNVDKNYLLKRTGHDPMFKNFKIAIIGCGAVGGILAQKLIKIGFNDLIFVDNDTLSTDNLMRHVLGKKYLCKNKALSLKEFFEEEYVDISIKSFDIDFDEFIKYQNNIIESLDLIIFATGDETLEKNANFFLYKKIRCAFTWVEPMGIGGHVFIQSFNLSSGCLNCLYENTLNNFASFLSPGQKISKTLSGCSGFYSSYSSIDADRTATEAAQQIYTTLIEKDSSSVLRSWYGSPQKCVAEGFKLSARSQNRKEWSIESVCGQDIIYKSCQCCGGHNAIS